MTLRHFYGLLTHWKQAPPTHLGVRRLERLVAAWMGVTDTDAPEHRGRSTKPPSETEIQSLVALAQQGVR